MTTTELLDLTEAQKYKGVWIIGDSTNGEFKRWHAGELIQHTRYVDGVCEKIVENEHYLMDYWAAMVNNERKLSFLDISLGPLK